MGAPPRPTPAAAAVAAQEDEDETTFFLASLAAATSTTTTTTSGSAKAALSLLPASPDFMAFQGFMSLGVRALDGEMKGAGNQGRSWDKGGWVGCTLKKNAAIQRNSIHSPVPQPHQLPLAFSCETPGGRVLLSSLRGDGRLRALWEQEGWLSRAR